MKLLDGLELVGYIEERQAKQVRALRQSWKVFPKLAIIQTIDSPVIDTYVRLKKRYGEEILIEVESYKIEQSEALELIARLNQDETVHGIIVQLPLADEAQTDEIVKAVAPEKDVDGLGSDEVFEPATPMAVQWLLAGYGIELSGKKIAMAGQGRLVGLPLTTMWKKAGLDVTIFDKGDDLTSLRDYQLVVTATGVPGLITSDMLTIGTIVVDAGTASEQGKIVGDVASEVYSRDDLTMTPLKGGVGPLTVAALFDNVINAARIVADKKGQQDL